MTGFGDARRRDEGLSVSAEVRAVNNRYLKIVVKCPEGYAGLEADFEKIVREYISRGTVSVTLRIERLGAEPGFRLNQPVVTSYWRQLNELLNKLQAAGSSDISSMLLLPGAVIEETPAEIDAHQDWPAIREVLQTALDKLQEFRRTEGASMQRELDELCSRLTMNLQAIKELAPQIVRDYRDRLHERVREQLVGLNAAVDPTDLIREVSIFSDRCDVNEELTRLGSHVEQFAAFLKQDESPGRKLDFLSQEMFREVNTIGAKANNVSVAHNVVEMKSTIEKMREILQNVE